MNASNLQIVSLVIFVIALMHTFSAKLFERLAHHSPGHAGLFHLLGEVEAVFGFWALVLILVMAAMADSAEAIHYAESRQYTEPLFVFAVMVVAASKPVLDIVNRVIRLIVRLIPLKATLVEIWLGLALVPILGSLITEPAAMTIAALVLAPSVFRKNVPEWIKYAVLGVLFVNVSIGGTLTSYAAPPVLMVASIWEWNTAFMASTFGWKAAIAVAVNATGATLLFSRYVKTEAQNGSSHGNTAPLSTSLIHLAFLGGIVLLAHHPVLFCGLFLFFLGFTQAYQRHQRALIIKEGLMVGFFLAGLVILGGMQQWWLQPLVSGLNPLALFFGATALTAITDNAALTYLGSLVSGLSDESRYMLMAGAVTGGGLTIIANAPNPAGAAILRKGFEDSSIGAGGLLMGALPPTIVAACAFLFL